MTPFESVAAHRSFSISLSQSLSTSQDFWKQKPQEDELYKKKNTMRVHPICCHFLSTLLVLIVVTASSEYNQIQHLININPKIRGRILHQPLFPSTSSSPPPPPPPPELNSEPIFPTPDHPFFPEVPAVQTPDQTQPQQIPPVLPNGTPVSRTNSIATQPTSPTKKLAIAVSVGIVTLGMLSALGFYIYKHKTKHPDETQKLVGNNNTHSFHREEESRMPPSNFLYIGTVEPSSSSSTASQAQMNHSIVANNSSPYRKLSPAKKSDRYRPSPELQPLPPLRNHHTVFTTPTIINSSDDDETKIYKPYNTSIVPKSNNSIPHSKRTSPRLSLSCSSPDIKRAIIVPSVKQTSPPSPPQPQPQEVQKKPTPTYVPQRVKFSQPPPPPDMSKLKSISNQYQQTSKPPAPPPPPPPPPPPLSTSQKLGGGVGSKATNFIEPPQRLQRSSASVSSQVKSQSSSSTPNSAHVVSEKRSYLEEQNRGAIHDTDTTDESKPKLKPLHWDKVRATSERATVWDQLKSSSFQLNEDMMESLFGCNSVNSVPNEVTKKSVRPPVEKENRVLDPKKSQNIAIMLRALNVTKDEVSEALLDGSAEGLGPELLESLVKMAPTKEEEIKLRDYNGDTSKLGSAERFLKAILDIPFAFKRVEAMLYRANFDTEVKDLKKSFQTLEEASQELKNSRLFFKLLEAVLRAGNRMNVGTNRGDARAFKLETLLKLIDIKGTDGKTTLLHFVVQEIIRSEGLGSDTKDDNNLPSMSNIKFKEEEFKKQGLQVVSGLSRELGNVKKAAGMDSDVLSGYVSKLEAGLVKVRSVLQYEKQGMEGNFFESMKAFLKEAEDGIVRIKAEERKALSMVKEVTEYFHGDAAKEEAHPLRIFLIVRDFLCILDSVCKDVGMMQDRTMVGAARSFRIATTASLPVLNRFNARQDRSWDDDSSSP